jgi:hypothetical protein
MKESEFLDHVREVIRINHFSYSTEKTYVGWVYRYIIFHNQRHPKDIDFELDEIIIRGGSVFHRWEVSVYWFFVKFGDK